jgi:hypothetical protein
MGKTKLDQKGYIVNESWQGGYPFPRPSGDTKAQKIMYNVEKRYVAWGQNFILLGWYHGYTKSLTKDFDGTFTVSQVRLAGRCIFPPFGWYDDRAKSRGEYRTFLVRFPSPRDVAGTAQSGVYYLDTDRADQLMLYIPSLRRIRKMSSTDSQDPIMGQDLIYDDNDGFLQKFSPTRYPYKYELLEEREFLIPSPTMDGSEYFDSEKLECHGLKFERRPMYVVQLIQLDPNYVYSRRIFYIDKETFKFVHVENYDQKGRLYRTWDSNYSFCPEMGAFSWSGALMVYRDHLDLHTTVAQPYQLPACYTRSDLSLVGLLKKAK